MDLSESPDPELFFTTDDEKTFQYQDQLPSLPVPDLQHTLDRYLDSGNSFSFIMGLFYEINIVSSDFVHLFGNGTHTGSIGKKIVIIAPL